MKDSYSTTEVCDILHLNIGRFREWLNGGYITPSVQQAKGVGTKNLFSCLDLLQIKAFKILLEVGMKREDASDYAANWIASLPEKTTSGGDSVIIDTYALGRAITNKIALLNIAE